MSVEATESPSKRKVGASGYDFAWRRRVVRRGKERGGWVYLPAEELKAAGIDPYEDWPLWYRVWGGVRAGVLVRLYREP